MFLPTLFLVSLCMWVQGDPFTVTAQDSGVSAQQVEEVRRATKVALSQLQPWFPDLPRRGFRVVVHAGAESLPAEAARGHHAGSPGLALLYRDEIHLLWREMRSVPGQGLQSVVTHEVVHILLHQRVEPWGDRVPRWFHEGLAQTLAGTTYLGAREEDLVWRATTKNLLWFSDLQDGFPERDTELQLAYGQSYSFVAWLSREFGMEKVMEAVGLIDGETTLGRAMVQALQRSTVALQEEWVDYLLHGSGARYRVLLDWCFPLSMVLVLPLLALAMIRRLRADRRARGRMEQVEELDHDIGNDTGNDIDPTIGSPR